MRWMDRVRSDMKEHQLNPKLARNQEAWRNAVIAIDKIGKGEQHLKQDTVKQIT